MTRKELIKKYRIKLNPSDRKQFKEDVMSIDTEMELLETEEDSLFYPYLFPDPLGWVVLCCHKSEKDLHDKNGIFTSGKACENKCKALNKERKSEK
jgi:hypothetical protein